MAVEKLVQGNADIPQEMPKVAQLRARSQGDSLWRRAIFSLLRDRLTIVAAIGLTLLTALCVLGPPLVEQALDVDANKTKILDRYKPPGFENHLLGTDNLGRDQFIRLLYGGRVSLGVAYGASIMSISIGLILGMLAGFYGGLVDDVINWLVSTLSSIPSIFLLILVSVIFTPSPEIVVILLGLLGWISTCRLVRGEVLTLKERDFIVAARAIGVPTRRLLTHHFFPNLLSLVIATLTIDAGTLILVESGLSYLGLGVRPPTPTWGNMLTASRQYFVTGPHLVVWPGLMIVLTVLCFYIVGDGLRDAFDPRTTRK